MKRILYVIAMEKEAKDIVKKLELKKVENVDINLYENEKTRLLITGIGKQRTAINLATYIALIALALKILPYKKNTFFIILTIPMFLCFASTYSVDGIGVGLASLFIAYFLKLYNDKENITLKNIIVLLCLYTLLLMFKSMSYIFVGLIMFLLPLKDIIKKYKKWIKNAMCKKKI